MSEPIPETSVSSEPVTLSYGRRQRAGWWPRVRFKYVVLGVVALVAINWGTMLVHRLSYWNLQRKCMNYTAPPERVVFESNPDAAKELLKDPAYARSIFDSESKLPTALYQTSLIADLEAKDRFETLLDTLRTHAGSRFPIEHMPLCFLGERRSTSGESRLIEAYAIPFSLPSPQGFSGSLTMRVIKPGTLTQSSKHTNGHPYWPLLTNLHNKPSNLKIYTGQPDPVDASHFMIRYEAYGNEKILDCWLQPDDSVKVVLRQPTDAKTP
jgi:hypothetical protein